MAIHDENSIWFEVPASAWKVSGLIVNGLIGIVAFIVTAGVTEWLLRRRGDRKPPAPQ